jgi:uncharacterized protein YggE
MMRFCKWLLVGFLVVGFSAAVHGADADKRRTISVNGEAEVLVVPDVITLTIGIETSSTRIAEAKSRNDELTSNVIQAAIAKSVTRDSIKTDYLHIEPRYTDWREHYFLGYYVQRNVVLELKNVARFEELLGVLLESGANYVHGIDFRTSELRKHRDQARALAIRAAREKAQALAAELGQAIGQPTTIGEGWSSWNSSYGSYWGGHSGSNAMQNVVSNASSGSSEGSSPTEPGKIRVGARVDVTFELETSPTLTAK